MNNGICLTEGLNWTVTRHSTASASPTGRSVSLKGQESQWGSRPESCEKPILTARARLSPGFACRVRKDVLDESVGDC